MELDGDKALLLLMLSDGAAPRMRRLTIEAADLPGERREVVTPKPLARQVCVASTWDTRVVPFLWKREAP